MKFSAKYENLSFDVGSLIACWFRKCLKTTDFS